MTLLVTRLCPKAIYWNRSSRPFQVFFLAFLFLFSGYFSAAAQQKARILHISSNHQGYHWSDHILQGIQSRLIAEDIELDVIHLNTSGLSTARRFEDAVQEAENKVLSFLPDVVITANDVAAKYVISPIAKAHSMPIIFTGLHGDPKDFDLPTERVTGIVEYAMVEPLIDLLQQYSDGSRIGLLSIDSLSGRNIQKQYSEILQQNFDQVYYARNFDLWKKYLNYLQDQVDLVILVDPSGLEGWEDNAALSFVRNNVRIPFGATDHWIAPLSLITIAKVPQEQGWWAADIAMKLVEGDSPRNIPISRTRDAKLFINFDIAERLGIVFSTELIEIGSKVQF
ncbi:MAG: ABC transporter substrate-binding protein [Acidiferrobacterales bacterium]|nr:ABC transporter substrate-binding protein [Acidiferrobacterales bacterium]